MRPEEVFTLKSTAVRLKDRFLKVERGKTPAARRRIDLTDDAIAILEARMKVAAELESPYLFPCDADSERPCRAYRAPMRGLWLPVESPTFGLTICATRGPHALLRPG
jgi:hypothetical protein